MKTKLICAVLLVAVMISLLAGCGAKDQPLKEAEAYAVVYEHAGVQEADAQDPHLHVLAEQGVVTYNIHFSANGTDYDYTINSKTGEIISHTP